MADASASERQKELREKRKSQGLCPRCGNPTADGYVYCQSCRDEEKNARYWCKQHGICQICHKGNVIPGKTICAVCNEKKHERYIKKHKSVTDKERETGNRRSAMVYTLRVQAGICCKCGEKPVWNNLRTCYECTLKRRRQDIERRTKKRAYKNLNGCYRCGKPCVPGKRLCIEHYKINVKSMENARQSENYKLSLAKKEIDSAWLEMKWRTQCC